MSEHALILYSAARHALAQARKVDEVMAVRDEAERLKLYTRQANDRELLADATEIHIRATRRLGELLVKANEAGQISVGRPKKNGSLLEPFPRVRLKDAGISKRLSHEAQKSASLSEQAFEAMVVRTRGKIAAGRAAVINPMKEVSTADKKERRAQRERDLGARQYALPDKKYNVILADPEWRFEPYSRISGMDRAADNQYPTSELEKIKARDVPSIAADDCALFLWATVPMLPQALEVMAAWGFQYKTHCIWHKDKRGTGYWFRNLHELLLLGTKGDIPAPAMGDQWDSVIDGKVTEHSAKPLEFRDMIQDYFPNLPKMQLNAREAWPGWDCWGNEAPVMEVA